MVAETLRRSPQEVDPLSWFTGPRLPIVLAYAALLQGLAVTILYWARWGNPWLELAALPFFVAAAYLIAAQTKPNRPQLGPRTAVPVLALSAAGLVVSALGVPGGTMPVEQWWAGTSFAITLASLAPYSSIRQLGAYAIPTVVFTAVIGGLTFIPISPFWPPVATTIICIAPVLVGSIAALVFSYTVVWRTRRLLAAGEEFEDAAPPGETELPPKESTSVARISGRVVPFLERIAAAGVIMDADRALAAQIARELRTDLVSAANRSWLDNVAHDSGLIVSDPGRLADQMNEAQRTTLRALLVAVLENAAMRNQALLIELRGQADGSIAVALSMEVNLPEGRRLMLIAPYYLTLKTTVEDLSWDDGRNLILNFRIPATSRAQLPE